MASRELHLYGRTRDALIDDAAKKGLRGRLVTLMWPPLRDSDAWSRLRGLEAEGPTTFATRLFPDDLQTTKAYDEYLERYFRFVDSAVDYDQSQTVHGLSATSRSCKGCGSHIALEHVRGETCPVCGSDLRSNTVQKTLERWRQRIAKVREQGEAEALKAGWLGSWAAVSVDGTAPADAGERRRTALRRSYDSEATTLVPGSDEEPLYLPRELLRTIFARARGRRLSPDAYLAELLGEDGDGGGTA